MSEMICAVTEQGMKAVQLLTVNDDSDFPIDGRELHDALGIETPYHIWFPRMCEYGFCDNKDYLLVEQKCSTNNPKNPWTTVKNHAMTISMAKEIAMVQRNEKGKAIRQYLIRVEEDWNKPEKVFARALQMANALLSKSKEENLRLTEENAAQKQMIAEMKPKVTYCQIVLECRDAIPIRVIAKDYGWSANRMNEYLHKRGVQYKQGGTWLLYQKYAEYGYTKSETAVYGNEGQMHPRIHTKWTQAGRLFIYDLLKADGIYPNVEKGEKVEQMRLEGVN